VQLKLEQALEHRQIQPETPVSLLTFFHPDYTVGTGFSPVHALGHQRNKSVTLGSWAHQTSLHHHRSGIGHDWPHPALKVYSIGFRLSDSQNRHNRLQSSLTNPQSPSVLLNYLTSMGDFTGDELNQIL